MTPKHVYRMGQAQSEKRDDAGRQAYFDAVQKPGFVAPIDLWFHDNTREPIRDETLRDGLVMVGAVVTLAGLPATSSKGRHALRADFAALFHPDLQNEALRRQNTPVAGT